ncbi:MAG TPA: glycosyltransferase family 4 protein, partial [Syntrophales bacterium]|nr:glycosyltransferase family 4 protein [Syntrophales bacterium]
FKQNQPYIFAAGRFVHKKGFDILIRAFHSLIERGYDSDLILAGDGPELPNYVELANTLKVNWVKRNQNLDEKSPCLIFWGWANKDEIKALMAGSEVFVVPSRKEPFGLVVLEAMAAETPVIATNVGGIPEILVDGCGLLVPLEDENALAEAIEKVLTHPDLKEMLMLNGRERVKGFSWENAAQSYIALASANSAI